MPDNQPNLNGLVNDPKFTALPPSQQRETLKRVSGNDKFGTLSDDQTKDFIVKLKTPKQPATPQPQAQPQPSSTSNPVTPYTGGYAGFTPEHLASATGQGLKNIVSQAGAGPKGEGGMIEIAASPEKYIPQFSDEMNEVRGQAKAALKRGGIQGTTEGMTKALFSVIPMMGPWLNDKYNQAMSGDPGGALAETATTAAAAKLVEHLSGKGATTVEDFRNAFPKHAVVAASNEALESSTRITKENIAQSFKSARENGIAQPVKKIVTADRIDSQRNGVPGFQPSSTVHSIIDQTVRDKNAGPSFAKATVNLPGTKIVKAALAKKGPFLSWDDLKDVRGSIDAARQGAGGKDLAILGDLQSKFTDVLKQRADQLGTSDEFDLYHNTTKALSDHQKGILTKLNNADTGLKFFNELAKQSNRPQLDDLFKILERHGGMPKNYLDDLLEDHSKIARLAALSEGTTYTGERAGRLAPIMRHPIVAGGAAFGAGVATSGVPLMGRFLISLVAAMKADDIMNRYEAARQIRELGGPSNVFGGRTPFQGPQSQPPQRPAGPGLPQGSGGVPPITPVSPAGLSPSLAKLLGPSAKEVVRGAGDISNEAKKAQALGEEPPVGPTKETLKWRQEQFTKLNEMAGTRVFKYTPKELQGQLRDLVQAGLSAEDIKSLYEKGLTHQQMLDVAIKRHGLTAQKIYQAKEAGLPAERHAEIESRVGRKLSDSEAIELDRIELARRSAQGEGIPKAQNVLNPDFKGKNPEPGSGVGIGSGRPRFTHVVVVKPDPYNEGKWMVLEKYHHTDEQYPAMRDTPHEGNFDTQEEAQRFADKIKGGYKPKVSKAGPEERGREPSARSGMTKETPEARRAKAAERVAKVREEAGRTKVKTSLEEQARTLAGKVTPASLKSVNIVDLEEAAKELDSTPGNMIYKGLIKLRKSQKWTDEVYRGYLEDFLIKQIDLKAGKGN